MEINSKNIEAIKSLIPSLGKDRLRDLLTAALVELDKLPKEPGITITGKIQLGEHEFRNVHQDSATDKAYHAKWIADGEADPFSGLYDHADRKAAKLTMPDLSDYELANAVFMHYDSIPTMEQMISGKAKMPIVYVTAAKERIRWLSRQLYLAKVRIAELEKAGE